MIRGLFFGRRISSSPHLEGMNPAVKAFITSEVLFWSAWNIIIPIFAVFVVEEIEGASVEHAAYAFTTYLLTRMVVELIISRRINHFSNAQRAIVDMIGMIIISLAYLGLAASPSFQSIFIFYVICGVGMGVAAPAKHSLFSRSLDKGTESSIWGVYDVSILLGMAISTSVGGYIAGLYGFTALLLIACVVNLLGILPYFFFIRSWRKNRMGMKGVR